MLLDYFFVSQRGSLLDLQTRVSSQSESISRLGQSQYAPTSPAIPGSNQLVPQQPSVSNTCPQSCLLAIKTATASPRPPLVTPIINNPVVNTKGEYFIPLGSAVLTQVNTWTDMFGTETTFDTANYPGKVVAAYFEASLRVAAGQVQIRLYDSTTPTVFWDAQMVSTSTGGESLSKPITISKGKKTYRIQMFTNLSTAYLDQARIRIVTQ